MKKIPLTQGKYALVDDEDYDFLMQWKWYFNNGYAVRGSSPKIMMHRIINKTPNNLDTDHRDEDKLNNQKLNLRDASRSQNQMNKGIQKNNTSGIRGVSWHKRIGKWSASIGISGKATHIGYFETIDLAEKAYKNVAHFLYGEFVQGGVPSKLV